VREQADVTWHKQDVPYIIDGSFYIQRTGGAKLSLCSLTAGVPVVTDCEITNSASWGIYQAGGTSPTLSGNTYSNNALGTIK
jgi:parallel beta-helix repeat protein